MEFQFIKENNDVKVRKQLCDNLIKLYPEKIPIICEKDPRSEISDIKKTKYLIAKDLMVAQFNYIIRKNIELKPEQALYLLVDGKVSIVEEMILRDVYEKYANKEDGFLYIVYSANEYFGVS